MIVEKPVEKYISFVDKFKSVEYVNKQQPSSTYLLTETKCYKTIFRRLFAQYQQTLLRVLLSYK
jgi:hypothetical protein